MMLAVVAAVNLQRTTPDAQKPNQYNNVCDALAPQSGCVNGVVQVKAFDPEAQKPNQYNNVCDAVSPQKGCVNGVVQVKRVCDAANP